MSKQQGSKPGKKDMPAKSGIGTNKLTEQELDQVNASTKDRSGCPACGSQDIFFNLGIGAWICSKCSNCWT